MTKKPKSHISRSASGGKDRRGLRGARKAYNTVKKTKARSLRVVKTGEANSLAKLLRTQERSAMLHAGFIEVLNPSRHAYVDAGGSTGMTSTADRSLIAETIGSLDLSTLPVWTALEERISGVEFVAMEVDGSTFDVMDGAFHGRAHVLLNAPYKARSGAQLKSSIAVPADIEGSITGRDIKVTGVELRF